MHAGRMPCDDESYAAMLLQAKKLPEARRGTGNKSSSVPSEWVWSADILIKGYICPEGSSWNSVYITTWICVIGLQQLWLKEMFIIIY